MSGESASSSRDEPPATDTDDSSPPPRCPRCDEPVIVVTSMGPADHTAQPCGCQLMRGQIESMLE